MRAKRPAEHIMPILLPLLLLSLGATRINCAAFPGNSTDVLSLQAFRHEISYDPSEAFKSWNSNSYHCLWEGVTCSSTHQGRVVALELSGLNLAGQISSSIGNLTFLRTLDLSTNSLSGQLPPLIHLQKLQTLNLSANSLHDVIPDALINCTNLRVLDLSHNSLIGEIPRRVDHLPNLSVLRLSFNNLTGIIPPTIVNITSLERLGLAYNQLTGSIPIEIGKLSNVWSLLLGGNKLSGGIPQSLFNMSSLEKLGLELNKLRDTLPDNMGNVLPNLTMLLMGGNMFEGQIPSSLGNASMLGQIVLAENSFNGQLPSSLGKLSNLYYLNLELNHFEAMDNHSWEFLSALGNCSSLQTLSLAGNQLQGVIPNSIGNLSIDLQYLYLGANNLSGIVPSSIGNLRGLVTLGLGENRFGGTIDEWIIKLRNLQGLYLQSNNFIGQIPSSIGNLTKLTLLFSEDNKFNGLIPPSLGTLQLLSSLDLSHNNLQGRIPLEFGNLKQLIALNLSSNKLDGEIPPTLGLCENLVMLQLDNNLLVGDIPKSFDNLKSLSLLNISHNVLSGTIPEFLNNLQFLRKLDLSYNNLHGEIPINGIFGNATAVSLDGNRGLCGGVTDLHMPSCRSSQRMERRYYLIKILIPIFGFMSLALLIYFLLSVKKATRSEYTSSTPFDETFIKVSYNDLALATMNFSESNLIGRGSYGSVYRGKLKEPNLELAVKVFDLEMRGAEKSFMSECEALRSIQHRNLLPILTVCSTVDSGGNVFKALIYEFMPNGSLDSWLHYKGDDGKTSKRLSLTQRISIAVNIADALDYLHYDCGRPTFHCDLKPSNVLLDDDMNALLGDFGIAKFYIDPSSTSTGSNSSVGVRGTIGYIAPEYAGGARASASGDVYSFGIVLLEMMTGKRPTDHIFKDGLDIVGFVDKNFPHDILNVMDTQLIEECKQFAPEKMKSENAVYQCLTSLLQVALTSARPFPSERMNMKEIASKMQAIKASYNGWKDKNHASVT